MLNLNYNYPQTGFSGHNCQCSKGLNQMGGPAQSGMMNDQMMLFMLNMMSSLMQMMAGVTGLSMAPGQFGAGGQGGSPLANFLGGGNSGGGQVGGSSGGGGGGMSQSASSGAPLENAGNVDPSTVKDKSSTSGINATAKKGLEEAHRFGLPLVSGKRSGGGTSDHDHGNAIDVGTLPIGAASSTGGTPQMKAYAEHMRQQGKAGKGGVKYVIADGRIASSRNNWEWRPYTYPGKSQGDLAALKRSNPGEYNRLQHNDHVHVSFN